MVLDFDSWNTKYFVHRDSIIAVTDLRQLD